MSISDGRTSVHDKISLKADDREIYVPPTTVDDLTNLLDCDEATDMDEDADGPIEHTSPLVNTGSGLQHPPMMSIRSTLLDPL